MCYAIEIKLRKSMVCGHWIPSKYKATIKKLLYNFIKLKLDISVISTKPLISNWEIAKI